MAEPMRLHKYMASCGVASRRSCEAMIAEGRVRVNGEVVTGMGVLVTPGVDTVEVDGKPVEPAGEMVYIALYKPEGYITTVSDPFGRSSVMDLVRDLSDVRLFPVGRLDSDSRGLLLMTNDGEFTNRLTHPRFHVEKEYRVLVRGIPNETELSRLRNGGVELDGRPTAPARVWVEAAKKNTALCRIVIREGRNRQVRRMFEQVGHPVTELTRIRIGPVWLKGIEPGKWRYLHNDEVNALMRGRNKI